VDVSQTDDLFLLAPPEASHEQNAGIDFFLSQWNGFVERGDTQPGCTFVLQRLGTFHRAMAIRKRLHHGADRDVLAYIVANNTVVLAQRAQRHFGPSRPSRRPLCDFNSRHVAIDYSGRLQPQAGYWGAALSLRASSPQSRRDQNICFRRLWGEAESAGQGEVNRDFGLHFDRLVI